jgi:protein-tyrosine phosphatase
MGEQPILPCCTRLPVKSLHNIRDLGGYPTQNGAHIVPGRFIRSDAPVRLDAQGIDVLLSYSIRHVIDLRSHSEIHENPNLLQDHPLIHYVNIPLLGPDLQRDLANLQHHYNGSGQAGLVELYRRILDCSGPAIASVMQTLADARDGARLFHCSHGKDRTGLIAALLLLLADVPPQCIIQDYQLSASFLKPWFKTFMHKIPPEDRHFFKTLPEYMKQTLLYLQTHYGSAKAYLGQCGVSHASITRLIELLLIP